MIIYTKPGEIDQVRFGESLTTNHSTERNDYFKNVIVPNCNDVLNGRGKSTHIWQGNVFYRDLIQYYKLEYIVAKQGEEQKHIGMRIVSIIRGLNPSGRFLTMDQGSGTWCDVGDEKAVRKIRQALREGAPDLRKQITPDELDKPLQDEMSEHEYKQFLEMIFQDEDMDCS